MGGSSNQTIGYRYFMGLHMAICHGPVDTVHNVYIGKRLAFASGHLPTSVNATAFMQASELFGGDKKEGGIFGLLDIELGGDAQLQNSYLVSTLGVNVPAFRGVTCAVFRAVNPNTLSPQYLSFSGGGYIAAMSPYPKPWAFEVTDIPGGLFNPTKQNINGGANGGHIIYDCLTDPDWGLGLPTADMDTASFTVTTDTLFTEGFSLSMIYAQQSSVQDFIQEVLDHINALIYTDRSTGQFVLKLIRDDYDAGTLPILDETNISSLVSFERPAFAEMVNEVTIKYRKQGDIEDSSLTAQDLASVQAQGGVISETLSFPGIDSSLIANRVSQRELKQKSTPLARVKLVANRDAWDFVPGGVFKLSWAPLGIVEVIFRIVELDYGTIENGQVRLSAIEDVFGLPLNTYLTPSDTQWTDEVGAPVAVPSQVAFELPEFTIQTTFTVEQLGLLLNETAFYQLVAENPSVASFNGKLLTRIGASDFAEVEGMDFAPTAELSAPINEQVTSTISIKNIRGGINLVKVGSYAYLNGEVLRIDSVDVTGGLLDVGRGYLDSLPQSHLLDDIIYFADSFSGVDPTFYTDTDTVDGKVLPQTGQGTLAEADSSSLSVVMVGRRLKPYNASQIKIGGSYFPTVIDQTVSIPVSWEHQDRTQQLTANGGDWYTTALGLPETGVTYTVRYYNNDTSTLLFTDSNLIIKNSSYTPATGIGVAVNIRVELETVRSGIICFKVFSHIFEYTKPLGVRALVNLDIRILENGDRRVLEG